MNVNQKGIRDRWNDRNLIYSSTLLPMSDWIGPPPTGIVATGFDDEEEQRLQAIREVIAMISVSGFLG